MKKKKPSLGRIFGELSFNILLLLTIFWFLCIFTNSWFPFGFLIILCIMIGLSFIFVVRSIFLGILIENYLEYYGFIKGKDDKII